MTKSFLQQNGMNTVEKQTKIKMKTKGTIRIKRGVVLPDV